MSILAPNLLDYEHLLSTIENNDVLVVQHVHDFPAKGKDFIMPAIVIAINTNGYARIQYDKTEDDFLQNEVSIVLPNHIIKAKETSDDYNITLVFLSPVIVDDLRYRSLTYNYIKYHQSPSCQLTKDQIEKLLHVVDVIKIISESNVTHKHDSLNYIINIFFELLNEYRNDNSDYTDAVTRKDDLFYRFCELLVKNYTVSREVVFYADKLCLTPKYFSKIIRDVTHQSAGTWITNYVVTIAKQLLTTRPDLNIQDVSNLMGFSDQAAFSRYFRRSTGMSPKKYKELNTTR